MRVRKETPGEEGTRERRGRVKNSGGGRGSLDKGHGNEGVICEFLERGNTRSYLGGQMWLGSGINPIVYEQTTY